MNWTMGTRPLGMVLGHSHRISRLTPVNSLCKVLQANIELLFLLTLVPRVARISAHLKGNNHFILPSSSEDNWIDEKTIAPMGDS